MKRDPGVDVVRGVAVLSMFIAHFAPSDGPFKLLMLSEFLTAPLFALLVGVGAQLGRNRSSARSTLVRAGVLIALGLWLQRLSTQIVEVLLWLGLLTLVCWALVRLSTTGVAVVATVLYALGPVLHERLIGDGRLIVMILAADPVDRLTDFIVWAGAGILVVRLVKRRVVVGITALLATAALFALDKAGVASLDPYSGTYQQNAFSALLSVAVFCGASVLLGRVWALAAVGGMSLSLYVAQFLVDWAYLATQPVGTFDDSWAIVAAMILGSVAAAVAWHLRFGSLRSRFRRGPLEGLVGMLGG